MNVRSSYVLLMPDHFCIVSDHAKLKFSFDRQNVSPTADSYNLPCKTQRYVTLRCVCNVVYERIIVNTLRHVTNCGNVQIDRSSTQYHKPAFSDRCILLYKTATQKLSGVASNFQYCDVPRGCSAIGKTANQIIFQLFPDTHAHMYNTDNT